MKKILNSTRWFLFMDKMTSIKKPTLLRIFIIIIVFLLAVFLIIFGISKNHDWSIVYIHLGTELGVAIIIYLLLERVINRTYKQEELKARLIRKLGSRNNADALMTAREIVEYGWHKDGTLRDTIIENGNLAYVEFDNADLTNSMISSTSLQNSSFRFAKLKNVIFHNSNLEGADFFHAILRDSDFDGELWYRRGFFKIHGFTQTTGIIFDGADLTNSNISMEQLASAKSLDGATMPDGRKWEDWKNDDEKLNYEM